MFSVSQRSSLSSKGLRAVQTFSLGLRSSACFLWSSTCFLKAPLVHLKLRLFSPMLVLGLDGLRGFSPFPRTLLYPPTNFFSGSSKLGLFFTIMHCSFSRIVGRSSEVSLARSRRKGFPCVLDVLLGGNKALLVFLKRSSLSAARLVLQIFVPGLDGLRGCSWTLLCYPQSSSQIL